MMRSYRCKVLAPAARVVLLTPEDAAAYRGSCLAAEAIFGGDEFVVILPDISGESGAAAVAQKLTAALAPPMQVDGHTIHCTASLGIALYPRDGGDAETLMKNADTAMYAAKRAGRNAHRFYAAAMNAASAKRLELENALRGALERGEFELHYQPQIDLAREGAVCGFEALLRWRHPERGLVSPAEFIPLAEETGLIVPIGEWVLHEACRQANGWVGQFDANLRVAVNLSARQFGFLVQRGCDNAQGYLIGRPQPADAAGELLRHGGRPILLTAAPGEAERTLLLVDDDEYVLTALQRLLRRDGYRILAAGNPAEAFDLLATNRIGVVISDQRMPGMNGAEFLRHVKDLYPDIVRIMLSGYTELQSVLDSINAGSIYRFLTKPWDDDQLRTAIREAFGLQELHRENALLSRQYREAAARLAELEALQGRPTQAGAACSARPATRGRRRS